MEEEKVEEVLPETEREYLETRLLKSLKEKQVAQTIMPLNPDRIYMNTPVIHNEFYYNPDTVDEDVEIVTAALARAENRLLFSGECTDWKVMSIQGLSTAAGRQLVAFTGDLVEDVATARSLLCDNGFVSFPFVLIIPESREEFLKPQIERVKEYALIDDVIVTGELYASDCSPSSALLVSVDSSHFWSEQSLPPQVGMWDAVDQVYVTLRETMMPVIEVGESIVEIHGIDV